MSSLALRGKKAKTYSMEKRDKMRFLITALKPSAAKLLQLAGHIKLLRDTHDAEPYASHRTQNDLRPGY